ncbi:response regulator [Paracraurococcus lichenis]|uniref:Response regulator n=1 Tax=Paracraurococcus lichenis TaxID=3064888 RepID=A0ABT9DV33_9PROT|nr:response regulator [Paracraurococcus sp. LOR1-02]MDO9707761.1 response regulator [Paracraurococcus sp. LOR1-02]
MSVKIGTNGVEISRVAAAAAAVAAGAATRADRDNPINQSELAANLAQGIEVSLSRPQNIKKTKRLLWVDDTPSNNDYLVRAFRDLGVDVVLAKSTQEGENALASESFDVVITDMSRPPEGEAGLAFAKKIREMGIKIPIIIYASYWASQHKGQESNFGVSLITNDPSAVYSEVLKRMLGS